RVVGPGFDLQPIAGLQLAEDDVLFGVGQINPRIFAERDFLGERALGILDLALVLLGINFHDEPDQCPRRLGGFRAGQKQEDQAQNQRKRERPTRKQETFFAGLVVGLLFAGEFVG